MIAKAGTTIDREFETTFGTESTVAQARAPTVLGVELKAFLQEAPPRLFQKMEEVRDTKENLRRVTICTRRAALDGVLARELPQR